MSDNELLEKLQKENQQLQFEVGGVRLQMLDFNMQLEVLTLKEKEITEKVKTNVKQLIDLQEKTKNDNQPADTDTAK